MKKKTKSDIKSTKIKVTIKFKENILKRSEIKKTTSIPKEVEMKTIKVKRKSHFRRKIVSTIKTFEIENIKGKEIIKDAQEA